MITDGKVLRPGQGIALRAVQLTQLGDDGELVISAGSETPSGELLAESVTRRRLEQELSARLGRPIRIRLTEPGGAPPPRVDEEWRRAVADVAAGPLERAREKIAETVAQDDAGLKKTSL